MDERVWYDVLMPFQSLTRDSNHSNITDDITLGGQVDVSIPHAG